jgi:hypothetical protein
MNKKTVLGLIAVTIAGPAPRADLDSTRVVEAVTSGEAN